MTNYMVFMCPRCGTPRYAREHQKTAKCLRCGSQIQLNSPKTRIFYRAKSRVEAIEAVKRYKMKVGSKGTL